MLALVDALIDRFPPGDAALIALVDLAVLIAIADGTIDDAEMRALRESMEALMGERLEPALVEHLVSESVVQLRAVGSDVVAREIGAILAEHEASEDGLRLAIAIGTASEGLSPPERERIGEVAAAAGVSQARLDEILATAT